MATQLVPYNTAMQLGSGFNSFTQTLCIDNAVTRDPEARVNTRQLESASKREISQSVTYKMSVIDKTSDVLNEMNIDGAFFIKYDQLKVKGSGVFANSSKIKESDVSLMVSVKVVNQTIYDHSLTVFQPIPGMESISKQELIDIYGDSFISGWQEGGEFLAVISIKAKNRSDAQSMKAKAEVAFSNKKSPPPAEGEKKDLNVNINAKFEKIKNDIAAENEVSIAVTWVGGGQNLKPAEKDWDFDTMKDVALKFPDACAKTPMRTHALLTKFTALRSFYNSPTFKLPSYDKTGTYINVLQEAYLDYKSILGAIQVLAFDVSENKQSLIANPLSSVAVEQVKAIGDSIPKPETNNPTPPSSIGSDESVEGSVVEVKTVAKAPRKAITVPPLLPKESFPASVSGLENARLMCRFMMNRIIQEIDNIAIDPEIAVDENRPSPYMSPFLFKMLLPIGVAIPVKTTQAEQAVAASKFEPEAMAKQMSTMAM